MVEVKHIQPNVSNPTVVPNPINVPGYQLHCTGKKPDQFSFQMLCLFLFDLRVQIQKGFCKCSLINCSFKQYFSWFIAIPVEYMSKVFATEESLYHFLGIFGSIGRTGFGLTGSDSSSTHSVLKLDKFVTQAGATLNDGNILAAYILFIPIKGGLNPLNGDTISFN